MKGQMRGRVYGVSVGPGDPEYLTLKAVRIIGQCPVVAAPRTTDGKSVALEIACGALDLSNKEILYLDFLMSRDREVVAARHRELAGLIRARLAQGQDIALLNLGDASIYASWRYLQKLLANEGYETQTIAGVPSFCACAAALDISLTSARLPLRILPGDYGELAAELNAPGTKVVMKQGRAMDRVKQALRQCDLYGRAMAVENCGMPNEVICHNLDQAGDAYLTTIIIGEAE